MKCTAVETLEQMHMDRYKPHNRRQFRPSERPILKVGEMKRCLRNCRVLYECPFKVFMGHYKIHVTEWERMSNSKRALEPCARSELQYLRCTLRDIYALRTEEIEQEKIEARACGVMDVPPLNV